MQMAVSLWFFTILLLFQDTAKPLPELKPFLAEVRKNLHTDGLLLSQYTYTEKRTVLHFDSNQRPVKTEVDVFDIFEGSPERVGYRRQIVRNGIPLTPLELQKEDEEFQKRKEPIERKLKQSTSAEREKARADRLKKEQTILDDVFAIYDDVEMVGRETLDGQPVILLNFRPRKDYKPKTEEGQRMLHVAGRAWISERDHQLARVHLEVIEPISIGLGILARLQKGATIDSERKQFNNEIWLPIRIEIAFNLRLMLLKGLNMQQIIEYSDHKKYSVDTILEFTEH
jgi:hypothetical protein